MIPWVLGLYLHGLSSSVLSATNTCLSPFLDKATLIFTKSPSLKDERLLVHSTFKPAGKGWPSVDLTRSFFDRSQYHWHIVYAFLLLE